jgi:hypothetical protein
LLPDRKKQAAAFPAVACFRSWPKAGHRKVSGIVGPSFAGIARLD